MFLDISYLKLSTSLYPPLLLAPPRIIVGYFAQSAMDLEVDEVFMVGQCKLTSFIVGESHAIVCPFMGIEQPTAQWYRGNTIFNTSDPRITIRQSTDAVDSSISVSTLFIVNLMSTDIGNYECRVSNSVVGQEVSEYVFFIEVG